MKNFDINRFWQTLKWTVLSEKKSILTAAVAFVAAFAGIQLFSCFTIFDLTHGMGEGATFGGIVTCISLMSILIPYYASGILGNARTKEQRTTALILPASNMEKFTARLVYCCIFMPLLIVVAFMGATVLRMLIELIFGHDGIIAGFDRLFYHFAPNFDSVMSFAFSVWSLSLFVLGGVFFRNRPFIWTAVTIIVSIIVFTTLGFYIGLMIGEKNIENMFKFLDGMSYDAFEMIVSLIFTAFTVLNVWLSYWLFKRLQVTQHKWFNV